MKFVVAVILVSMAVAAFAQVPAATASQATGTARTTGSTGGAMGGGGLNQLMTLGLLTGRGMGGDFVRDMMYCNMMRLPAFICMGGLM